MNQLPKSKRFNVGKIKWTLVHFKSIECMVEVLMFGSSKYFTIFAPELEKRLEKWNVKTVRKTELLEQKNFVQVAMKDNCLIRILSVKELSKNIEKSITKKTLINLKRIIETEKSLEVPIQNIRQGEEILSTLENMESHQKNLTKERKKVVSFVKKNLPLCTQTTTITLGNLEVCFAVSAITGLDSSTTTLRILEELLNISIDPDLIFKKGEGNWKIGLNLKEIEDSMQRHLASLIDGEIRDPESGLYHIGHIMCNSMFWMYHYTKNKNKENEENY